MARQRFYCADYFPENNSTKIFSRVSNHSQSAAPYDIYRKGPQSGASSVDEWETEICFPIGIRKIGR